MTIIYAIIMFCILIFVHELGHFVAAKACGIKVNKFALGMGPAIFKRQKGETEYSLRILPIGGFCAMEGEDEESSDDRAFNNKPAWKKTIVVIAGSFMNILLAIILMTIVAFNFGVASNSIGAFVEGSKAKSSGLEVNDEIVKIEDKKVDEWEDIGSALKDAKGGETVSVTVIRDDKEKVIKTELVEQDNRAMIGISPKMEKSITAAIANGPKATWNMTKSMYSVIKQLFTGDVSAKELTGPVGIVYMVNETSEQGFVYLLYLMALISLNLGIVNMLPLPALDGGRLLFIIIRKITGKAITDEMEGKIQVAGFLLLMVLMVYVTWNDIIRFIVPLFK